MRIFFFFHRIISSSELQFFASRHAAAIAAVAAAALPPPPSSSTNPNGLSNSASGLTAPPPVVPPTHQHDFHPAYRIPGYMEHLYSLQHASAASSSSLHGKNFDFIFSSQKVIALCIQIQFFHTFFFSVVLRNNFGRFARAYTHVTVS